ncbi:MAG: hypothetical protein FWH46_00690 [Methanimicrococcus sp.]|nr:hypothetical protein [Methanimicrococcus sp.]
MDTVYHRLGYRLPSFGIPFTIVWDTVCHRLRYRLPSFEIPFTIVWDTA